MLKEIGKALDEVLLLQMYDSIELVDTINKDHQDEANGCGWADVMDIALLCDTGGPTGLWSDDFCGSSCHIVLAPFYAKCSSELDEGQANLLSTGIYALLQCETETQDAESKPAIPAPGSASKAQCALLAMNIADDVGALV